jgi:hypothetical protein
LCFINQLFNFKQTVSKTDQLKAGGIMDKAGIRKFVAGIGIAGLVAGISSSAFAENVKADQKADGKKPAPEAGATGCGGMDKCPDCKKMKADSGSSGCGGAMQQKPAETKPEVKPASTGCGGASGCGGAMKQEPAAK